MNKTKPLDRSIRRAGWLALAGFLLLTSSAQGMYDPHHGRWFQRDPLGVRPDAPRAEVALQMQTADGQDLYEYVRSNPASLGDPEGLWTVGTACRYACGQCFNACSVATGCDDGDCSRSKRLGCQRTLRNCHMMCAIAQRPTKRCGGGSFQKKCTTLGTPATAVGLVVVDASWWVIIKNCSEDYPRLKLGCRCGLAVSLGATLISIKDTWKTAQDITRMIDHIKDYNECMEEPGADPLECGKMLQ